MALTPVCQSLPFDLGVYYEGNFYRLQVKRAFRFRDTQRFVIEFCGRTRRSSSTVPRKGLSRYHYTEEHTDFIVGVVIETGDCYCFPVRETVALASEIQVDPTGVSTGKAHNRLLDPEKFKNILHLQGSQIDLVPWRH